MLSYFPPRPPTAPPCGSDCHGRHGRKGSLASLAHLCRRRRQTAGGWPVKRHVYVNGYALDRRRARVTDRPGRKTKVSHKSGASARDQREPCGRRYRGRRRLHWYSAVEEARAHTHTQTQTTTIRSFPVNAKSDAFSAGNSAKIIAILVKIIFSTLQKKRRKNGGESSSSSVIASQWDRLKRRGCDRRALAALPFVTARLRGLSVTKTGERERERERVRDVCGRKEEPPIRGCCCCCRLGRSSPLADGRREDDGEAGGGRTGCATSDLGWLTFRPFLM